MATVNQVLQTILSELKKLSSRVATLESRVSQLEGGKGFSQETTTPTKVTAPSLQPDGMYPAAPVKQTTDEAPQRGKFEAEVGVAWLGKIGIVAIAIGMVYFLRYTMDSAVFGIAIGAVGRISIGFIVGILMLSLGEFVNTRYPQWSREFTGGGLGLLYFAIFSASNLEQPAFIPFSAGLVLMSLVTIAAGWFSIRYNSKIIATFGFLGGYLTPILIGFAAPSYNRMLFYILILNIAVAIFAYFRKWRILNALAIIITAIYALASYFHLDFTLSLMYTIIFFLLFVSLAIIYNLANREKTTQEDLFVLIVNPLITTGFIYWLLTSNDYENVLGLTAIIFALFYLVLSAGALARNKEDKYLALTLVGLAAGFVAIAIPWQLKTLWITIGWSVQFLAMLWIGLHLRQSGTRLYALIVGILVLIRLFAVDIIETGNKYETAFFNPRVATSLFVIVFVYFGAYLYKYYKANLLKEERKLVTALAVIANIITLYFISFEINYAFILKQAAIREATATITSDIRFQLKLLWQWGQLLTSFFWLIYATILIMIGIVKKYRSIRILALVLFLLSILKIVIYDLSGFETIYRVIAFILLGILLIFTSFLYTKNKEKVLEFIIDKHEDEDVTTSIESMDAQGKTHIIFSLLNGKQFKVTNENVVKICLAIQTKYGKTNFQANELLETYNYYDKNFRSQLNPADLKTLKQYLYTFAVTGGSFEIK